MSKLKSWLAAFLLVALALAIAAPGAWAADYKLGIGDKLRIKVHEWPDLSGEYFVSPAETVSLPIVGELKAGGITTRELAKAISDRLRVAAKMDAEPSATVEIVAFRPFFVMGDVAKPGEYPYRPGLTVLQAISIAGGYYRPVDTAFRFERDAISARGDILVRSREIKQFAARIARLEAEQKNATSIDFPKTLDSSASSPDRVLIEEENAIMAANNDGLNKTLQTLDHYIKLYEQEIDTIKEQINSQKHQLTSAQKELSGIRSLAEKGLAVLPRQLEAERTEAQIESAIEGLQATILRARQNISQTEQRRIELLNTRTNRINTDLQKARADAEAAASQLKTSRNLLVEAEVTAPAMYAAVNQPDDAPKFTIARHTRDGVQTVSADSNAEVLPGDVLTVERRDLPSGETGSLAQSRAQASASE